MKIAIIGAGAMGGLFGSLLAHAGETVTLLDSFKEHVDTINAQGLTIEKDGQKKNVSISATTDADKIGTVDLALVFVKSTNTSAVAQTAANLVGRAGMAMTLQNGMGNADILADALDASRVIAGTTAHGATFLGPGAIRHAGEGETVIGPWTAAGMTATETVAKAFDRAGIAIRAVDDVHSILWAKLFVNIGINAITALTGIKNGELLDLESTREIARQAVQEAMAVAVAKGISIEGDPVEKVFRIAEATGPNRSSMGQDVDQRRPTEIAAINGFIVRTAKEMDIPVPVNRTLSALIETLQAHY